MRMGKGKGSHSHYVDHVTPGNPLLRLKNIDHYPLFTKTLMSRLIFKLPIKVKCLPSFELSKQKIIDYKRIRKSLI